MTRQRPGPCARRTRCSPRSDSHLNSEYHGQFFCVGDARRAQTSILEVNLRLPQASPKCRTFSKTTKSKCCNQRARCGRGARRLCFLFGQRNGARSLLRVVLRHLSPPPHILLTLYTTRTCFRPIASSLETQSAQLLLQALEIRRTESRIIGSCEKGSGVIGYISGTRHLVSEPEVCLWPLLSSNPPYLELFCGTLSVQPVM